MPDTNVLQWFHTTYEYCTPSWWKWWGPKHEGVTGFYNITVTPIQLSKFFGLIHSNSEFCFGFCTRLQQQSTERVIDLTDSFKWQDLPTRDDDTAHLTEAGWIPLIKMFSTTVTIVVTILHFIQSTTRMVTNHEIVRTAW